MRTESCFLFLFFDHYASLTLSNLEGEGSALGISIPCIPMPAPGHTGAGLTPSEGWVELNIQLMELLQSSTKCALGFGYHKLLMRKFSVWIISVFSLDIWQLTCRLAHLSSSWQRWCCSEQPWQLESVVPFLPDFLSQLADFRPSDTFSALYTTVIHCIFYRWNCLSHVTVML